MSNQYPEHLKYTKEHEWALIEGDVCTIGITDYAQSSLGDIVFVELPEKGKTLDKDATFGVVESVKSVSDLYAPISGEVVEINQDVVSGPEKINENPYESWLLKIKIKNNSELSELLSPTAYRELCESSS